MYSQVFGMSVWGKDYEFSVVIISAIGGDYFPLNKIRYIISARNVLEWQD